MLSCAGADRLQTGMRHAFGKPCGIVARVKIGQIMYSVRAKEIHLKHVIEALRRAKYKFPGRQHIVQSKKWGFTHLPKDTFVKYRDQGRLVYKGTHVKVKNGRGKLDEGSVLLF